MNQTDIMVIYGTNPKEMAFKLCEAAGLEALIGSRRSYIGIKPNLVLASKAENGATTHPEIVAGVVEYLHTKGYQNIAVIEGSWLGDRTEQAFRVCGYTALAEEYGIRLIDTQKDNYHSHNCAGMNLNICDSALEVDFMINLPVLKGHCQTTITCALKNNKGVIPNTEKRHFHTMGLHKPIAHLNTVVKNDFILVDGICGDLDFEEGGTPVAMNRLLAAVDPVLCDSYVCSLMGHDTKEVPYIKMAEALGVGSTDLEKANIIELNSGKDTLQVLPVSRRVRNLVKKVRSEDACSACYGSLVHALLRLDEKHALERLPEPISIGQDFRGKCGNVGIGSCTGNFDKCLKGCPPKAADIVAFLTGI